LRGGVGYRSVATRRGFTENKMEYEAPSILHVVVVVVVV